MLKTFLKKWLDVPEDKPSPVLKDFVVEGTVRELVKAVIEEALEPWREGVLRGYYWSDVEHKKIYGIFEKLTKSVVNEYAGDEVTRLVKERLEPESFIDGVVERINKKQLKSGK